MSLFAGIVGEHFLNRLLAEIGGAFGGEKETGGEPPSALRARLQKIDRSRSRYKMSQMNEVRLYL